MMNTQIETFVWSEPGYQPLLFSDSWQVAILNWESSATPANIAEIERHINTDEVFILGKGDAALFTEIDNEVQFVDLRIGILYNVPRGRWHNLVMSRDSLIWIVENRNTHVHDTEIRMLNQTEKDQIQSKIPLWAKDS